MKIQFVIHSEFELPKIFTAWVKEKGFSFAISRPFAGDPMPELFDFDWLILLGGPQRIIELDRYLYLESEIRLIAECYRAQKVVLGICLGAQLIGEALGAQGEQSPYKEVGVFPIELTEAGRLDPLLKNFPQSFDGVHWHNDMPGLTKAAKVLATSPGCPRQIVRYSPKTYGLQCHLEPTLLEIKSLIEQYENDLEPGRFVQKKEALLKSDFTTINNRLIQLLDNLLIQTLLEKETNHGYINPQHPLKPFALGSGSVQPLLESKTLELFTLTNVQAGAGPGAHFHREMEETFYVIAGTFQFRVDDREMILQPGDSCSIPPKSIHQWTTIQSEKNTASWKLFVSCCPAGNQINYLRALAKVLASGKSWNEVAPTLTQSFDLEVV